MLVILPSVLAVPSLELQQQQQPNALPSSQGKFVKSNNGATTSTTGNKATTTSTAAAGAAAISQHVNSSNNQQNSNSNNNSDNDLYITANAVNATNSAVKIILNDYSDAFSQIINNENEQQQQQRHQQLHSGHQNSTSPDDYLFDFHHDLLDSFRGTHSLPRQPMYTNEFAVHIPAGPEMADIIANKYGFTNMGQVSFENAILIFKTKN